MDYDHAIKDFESDYDRTNPVLRDEAMSKWLSFLQLVDSEKFERMQRKQQCRGCWAMSRSLAEVQEAKLVRVHQDRSGASETSLAEGVGVEWFFGPQPEEDIPGAVRVGINLCVGSPS